MRKITTAVRTGGSGRISFLSVFVVAAALVAVFVFLSPEFGWYEQEIVNNPGKPRAVPSSPEKRPIKLVFVGDIMLSRQVGMKMAKTGDYGLPFKKISAYLNTADLAFGNLENPVSSRGTKVGSIYSFRADPKTITGLNEAGFDVLSIANNHIWDYSGDAFFDTLDILDAYGINYAGAGLNYVSSHTPVIKEVRGKRISFLAYTNLYPDVLSAAENKAGVNIYSDASMIEDIRKAKEMSELIVVSVHMGDEYQTKHNPEQERVAKLAIDSGASIFIGHHPHVVQEVEQYKNGWIAYSLGNFIFDQNFSEETMSGLIFEVTIMGDSISAKSLKTIINNDFQVELVK